MLTAAVALGVAALTLLSPLERRLRDQELRALVGSAVQSRSSFRDLELRDARPGSPELQKLARRLGRATGARIAVLDSRRRVLVDTDPDERDAFKDVPAALSTDRPVRRVVRRGSAGEARLAVRVRIASRYFVLAVRKPLDEQRSAVSTVRRAFVTAAVAALAVALLIATLFATTVLLRLRRLRDAVVDFDASNPVDDLPADRHSDEVADLARAFAEMRERLVQQEAIRRAFVATASHELRTPLMSLQGQLELLHEDLDGEGPDIEDARRQLAGARTQSARLGRLAADLLDLSRLDAHLDMRAEPVELSELSRAVAAEFEARAQAAGTPIELEAQDAVWAHADPGAVARILRILLDNALRYSPRGAAVRVSIRERDGGVAVSVADEGPGVPEPERERIFARFERGPDETNGAGGFGLGLAIGRELAERMSGRLALEHAEPGATRFALWLPGPVGG